MERGASRWQKSKTWRSLSSPQIHQKYIFMWNNSYRTPTECWQKTSDLPKGKKLPTYLGRAKEKRKTLKKIEKILEMSNLSRLNQTEIEILKRPITSNEIKSII